MRFSAAAMAMAATVSGASLLAPSPAWAMAYPGCHAVTLYSHRGDQSLGYTENSLASFLLAMNKGYGFETDLRTSQDGRIIVMHDSTIDRTTMGTGRVDALTGHQIRSYPLNDGSTVPYGAEALRLLGRHPEMHAFMELKPGAMPLASQKRLRAKALEYGVRDQLYVYSFDRAELASFAAIAPAFHTSLIRAPGKAGWKPSRFLRFGGANVRGAELNDQWISRAHAIGLPLNGRDAEDVPSWEANIDAGVQGQILDRTDAYNTWCQAHQ